MTVNSGWCINPDCAHPDDPGEVDICQWCGTALLLAGRYRAIHPLQNERYPLASTALFEAIDQSAGNQPKVLKVLCEPSRAKIARLEQEYNVLTLLDAPGKIPRADLDGLFSVPTSSLPVHCLVMEKMAGQPLNQWLEAGNRLSQENALIWLRQLIEIIAVVHDRFYFHRDVKPDNLILQPNGQLALIDFGACRRISETYLVKLRMGETPHYVSPNSSYSITAVGSAGYSPLEQLHGRGVPQSDFFAIARTLVHLLTGRHPAQLPLDDSGQLLWRKHAPQVAGPLADFLDELQSPAWRKRPSDTEIILQRLNRLPQGIRRYQLFMSTQFKAGMVVAGILTAASFIWGVNSWATYQQLSQARQLAERGAQNQLVGRLELARQNYQGALDLDPNLPEVHQNLALLCQSEGNVSCAIEHYQQALKLTPDNWQVHYNLGNLYDEQGDYSHAERHYRLAMQAENRLGVDAANNLSRINNIKGDYREAALLAAQALKQTKDSVSQAALLKNLGWATLKQSNYRDALKYLQRAKKLDPQRADIYCLLAQAQEDQGFEVEAKQSWKNCLRYDSTAGLPEVKAWRERILNRVL